MVTGRGLRWTTVAVIATVTGLVGFLVQRSWTMRSGGLPAPSWASVILLVAMSIGIVATGIPIRRALRGEKKRRITAVRGLRTLVLAQAAAVTGGLVVGWYGGLLLALAPDAEAGSVQAAMVVGVALVVGGALLAGSGLWVQAQCRIDPPDDDGLTGGSGTSNGPTSSARTA